MKRYGEKFELTHDLMGVIETYMDDEIREQLHSELAPCNPEYFLKKYCELDPVFEILLFSEFNISI